MRKQEINTHDSCLPPTRFYMAKLISDDPFASRQERNKFAGNHAADIRQDGDAWDGQCHWNKWICLISIDKNCGNIAQKEHVHQVHAKRKLRNFSNPSWCFYLFDAREEEEGTKGGKQYVGRTELP